MSSNQTGYPTEHLRFRAGDRVANVYGDQGTIIAVEPMMSYLGRYDYRVTWDGERDDMPAYDAELVPVDGHEAVAAFRRLALAILVAAAARQAGVAVAVQMQAASARVMADWFATTVRPDGAR